MKLIDLLRMSVSNLWRRKLRTFLTVLGVIIGTASIVVMISLGLGLTKSTMDQIEELLEKLQMMKEKAGEERVELQAKLDELVVQVEV